MAAVWTLTAWEVDVKGVRKLCVGLPYQIAAEQKAEDEDKDRRSEHHDVDVEGQVLKSYIRHPETVVLEIRGHGYPGGGEEVKREWSETTFLSVSCEDSMISLLC